jgi:hypothetical protein
MRNDPRRPPHGVTPPLLEDLANTRSTTLEGPTISQKYKSEKIPHPVN